MRLTRCGVLLLAAIFAAQSSPSPLATLAITHPPDGGTIAYAPHGVHANASLRTDFWLEPGSEPAQSSKKNSLRLCVEVQRAEAGTYTWFAEGCFSTAQPITLMLPTAPANYLVKAALADGSVALAHAQTAFALRPTPAFYPTYEWAVVPPGAPVPPGLEVQMALDGSGSLARMPDPWRLQLSLSTHLGMFRTDVYRDTTIGELAGELAGHALRRQQMHPHEIGQERRVCASFSVSSEDDGTARELPLPPGLTAEACQLFAHQSRLRVSWHPCDPGF